MIWSNVKLIAARELRDQLRDRRTLFTVVVLPLLLYPFMGISLIQVTQFFREHPTRVWLLGAANLPDDPALLIDGAIAAEFRGELASDLLEVYVSPDDEKDLQALILQVQNMSDPQNAAGVLEQLLQRQMAERKVDLVAIAPQMIERGSGAEADNFFLFSNSASDKSRMALQRFSAIVHRWQEALIAARLAEHSLSLSAANPVRIAQADVAQKMERQAAAWSKTLPLLIVIWCLTGAFYPAVDLCAGEKERGTFETLLSSPANRSEIALGKLLTVIAFSMSTAVLNLISMGFTSLFVLSRISHLPGAGNAVAALGPPPLSSLAWLILAIIPVAALFSAVSLAAAAFARSSKEGQYYLVPLIMASMPLMVLPMLPAAKLDVGTSLIPITNVMLTLRLLIEGDYANVLPYLSLVGLVTGLCVFGAVRWVVHQFNSESVMFRASERFGVGVWLVQLFKERDEMPALGHALICGVLILLTKFFVSFTVPLPLGWTDFARQTVVVLVATVAMPAVLMAIVLTRRPDKALKLGLRSSGHIAVAILLAVCWHPLFTMTSRLVLELYPPGDGLKNMNEVLGGMFSTAPSIGFMLLIFAVAPALLEELAFRGFILSGAQGTQRPWLAIFISSFFFGAAHAVFQQSILTFLVGLMLGYLAVRSGSIWPCVAYHAVHNALTVTCAQMQTAGWTQGFHWLAEVNAAGTWEYHPVSALMMTALGCLLLYWFHGATGAPTASRGQSLRSWFPKVVGLRG